MHKLFFLSFFILIISCKSLKAPEKTSTNLVQLNIIDAKKGKSDSVSDIDITEIINNTNKDFYIPKPIKLIRYSYVISPEFFDIELNGYECEQGMIFNDGTIKKSSDFTKVKAKTKEQFIINPSEHVGLECIEDGTETRSIQMKYVPNPEELKSDYVKIHYNKNEDLESLINIYDSVLRDTITSTPFILK